MTIYNITHISDLDGMASAALLVKNFGIPLENIFFFDYSASIFSAMREEIMSRNPRNSLFILSDAGVNQQIVKSCANLAAFLKKNGNSIMWLDHHVWNDESIRMLSKYASLMIVGENSYCCGADIVYKLLCRNDPKSEKLVELTHISDLYLKPKSNAQRAILERYAFGIKYLNMQEDENRNAKLRKLIYFLSIGKINNSLIKNAHSRYKKIFIKSVKILDDSAQTIKAGRIKIALGFAPDLQSTFAAHRLRIRNKVQIGAYVNTSRIRDSPTCSLRSAGKTSCLYIAERFGGGGHPHACAFKVPKRYNIATKEGREAFIKRFAKLAAP